MTILGDKPFPPGFSLFQRKMGLKGLRFAEVGRSACTHTGEINRYRLLAQVEEGHDILGGSPSPVHPRGRVSPVRQARTLGRDQISNY
jgi:hypothetical protein